MAYELATQGGALNKVTELQAIPFRGLPDFMVLLLALASAAALAWRRRFALFETALLGFAAAVAFRSQRDVWAMAAVGALILASTITGSEKAAMRLPKWATAIAALAAALALPAGFRAMHVTVRTCRPRWRIACPCRPCRRCGQRATPGRCSTTYNWGGYLIWALRMPVSIDGRQNLYGDQRIDRSVATWSAEPDWATDAQLIKAGVVIGPVKAPLTQVLRMDSRFQLVYEDKLAAVFVARRK